MQLFWGVTMTWVARNFLARCSPLMCHFAHDGQLPFFLLRMPLWCE